MVVKRYQGPDAATRRRREYLMLDRLRGRLPVPPLLGGDEDAGVRMGLLAGMHGQELIEAGHAGPVLRACGEMLRHIHTLDPGEVFPDPPPSRDVVLVHGDFGPNNVLLDPDTFAVTAVLDWEWAHAGHPVEDLAWCEWILRMHHGDHLDALGGFFDGYGHRPAWAQRHDAMLARCRSLLELCHRWTGDGVRVWQRRLEVTAAWTE
jgi:Ser/Thr protein kinase RdoA (MazF antagonist)